MKMKIAIVQQSPVMLNLIASLDRYEEIIAKCPDEDIIVFPETWLPGYPIWLDNAPGAAIWGSRPTKKLYHTLVKNSVALGSPQFNRLISGAAKHKKFVVIGIHELNGTTLYNTQLFIDNKGNYNIHRKLVPTYTERLYWGMGDGSTLNSHMETPWGIVGGLICWEHWMPQLRIVMHEMNEVLHVAQWPSSHEVHLVAARQYAFEAGAWVVSSGTSLTQGQLLEDYRSNPDFDEEVLEMLSTMRDDDSEYLMNGGSALISPFAEIVQGPALPEAELIRASADLDLVVEAKLTLDVSGHYSRPDIFTLNVDRGENKNIEYES